MKRSCRVRCAQRGAHLVEVLLALALLAAGAPPLIDALRASAFASGESPALRQSLQRMQDRMEEVLALPLATLDAAATAAGSPTTPSSLSDAAGTTARRLVYLARYDGDNADGDGNVFTGGEAELIWVKVQIEGDSRALATLTTR